MSATSHPHDANCGCGHDPVPRPILRNLISCGVLALWGGVLLYFYTSGRIEHYLSGNGPFRVQCLLAGGGLLMLAGANLWSTLRGQFGHHHDGPPFAAAAWGNRIVLVVPLAVATLFSPDRFSDEFVLMKVHAASGATAPAVDPHAFSVEELVRLSGGRTTNGDIPLGLEQVFQIASQPDDVRAVVESVTIETIGQLVRDPVDPTCWRLSRLMITCCAADAQAISVAIRCKDDPSQWQQLDWYRAVGRVEEIDTDGLRTPVFRIESMTAVEPPHHWMLY